MTESIGFGRQGSERQASGRSIALRSRTELCIPIDEEQGWRIWFWFPGRSYSATAHWWVREAEATLIGEWLLAADAEAHTLHGQMMQDPERVCAFIDDPWNTFMVLPGDFRANLIPRFAVGVAEASDCARVKISEDMLGEAVWHSLDPVELAAKWMISQLVAEANQPEDFLGSLAAVFRKAEKIGWIAAWLNLYLPFIARANDG